MTNASKTSFPLINIPLQRGVNESLPSAAFPELAAATSRKARTAFTLIELLIVIAIIAILAALIIPITGAMTRKRMIARAGTELHLVELAIENYKTKLGHYPPDNPGLPSTNQLYFELMGTTNDGNFFVTLDGSARVLKDQLNRGTTPRGLGVRGFVNTSAVTGGEEGRTAQRFIGELKTANLATLPTNDKREIVNLICCSVAWPFPRPALQPANGNPFRYNSSNPTNNPNSFDLWVDIIIAGKTNRISNWSSTPTIVGTP